MALADRPMHMHLEHHTPWQAEAKHKRGSSGFKLDMIIRSPSFSSPCRLSQLGKQISCKPREAEPRKSGMTMYMISSLEINSINLKTAGRPLLSKLEISMNLEVTPFVFNGTTNRLMPPRPFTPEHTALCSNDHELIPFPGCGNLDICHIISSIWLPNGPTEPQLCPSYTRQAVLSLLLVPRMCDWRTDSQCCCLLRVHKRRPGYTMQPISSETIMPHHVAHWSYGTCPGNGTPPASAG